MPKAVKYYTDEELDQKIKEMEALKEARAKERQTLLDRAKIAYMDNLIENNKGKSDFNSKIAIKINEMIANLNPRKDKDIKKALEEFLKLFL